MTSASQKMTDDGQFLSSDTEYFLYLMIAIPTPIETKAPCLFSGLVLCTVIGKRSDLVPGGLRNITCHQHHEQLDRRNTAP